MWKTLDTKFKGSEHLPLVYRKTKASCEVLTNPTQRELLISIYYASSHLCLSVWTKLLSRTNFVKTYAAVSFRELAFGFECKLIKLIISLQFYKSVYYPSIYSVNHPSFFNDWLITVQLQVGSSLCYDVCFVRYVRAKQVRVSPLKQSSNEIAPFS